MALPDGAPHSQDGRAATRHGHVHRLHLAGNQLYATVLVVAAVLLIPWIVFLAVTLPLRYNAGNWRVLWVGFDVALVAVIAYTGWAAWFRRQVMAATTLVTGVLLACDAWFDILTSLGHRDEWLSLLTGFGAELPLSLACFWLYHRIVMRVMTTLYQRAGEPDPPRRLRDIEIVAVDPASRLRRGDPARP